MESGNGDDYLEFSDFSLFYVLPNELVVSIFGYLSVRDLCWRVSRVCKQWHSLASDGGLWKELYAKQWPNLPSNLREKVDYEAYVTQGLRLRQASPQLPVINASSPMMSLRCPESKARSLPLIKVVFGGREQELLEAAPLATSVQEAAHYDEEQEGPNFARVAYGQRNSIADAVDNDELSGDDSGDDSGDEGDDSGDEGSEPGSEDEAVLTLKPPYSGDEMGYSPRMARPDDIAVVGAPKPTAGDGPASPSSSTSTVPMASVAAALPELVCADTSSEDDYDFGADNEEEDEENKGTFECFTESFESPALSSVSSATSLPTSPALSSASASPFSSAPSSPAVMAGRRYRFPGEGVRMRGKGGSDDIDWHRMFAERAKRNKSWTGKPNYVATLRDHTLAVMSVIANGNAAASCSLDGTIRTWDLDKRRCTGVFSGHTDWVNSIDYDFSKPDLDYVVSGSYDTSVRLWDTKNKKCRRILWGHQNIVWSVQLAGNRVVSCSSDATVRVWDAEAGVCTQTLTGHGAAVYCCQYDPARNVVVTGSMDKTLRFWDLDASGNSKSGCVGVMRGHTDRLCCLQEDAREHLLVSGSRDSSIRLWDTRVLEGAQSGRSALYSSSGESRACFRVLRGHEGRVCCLQFDEDKIVSGSDDNTVKVWSLHGKGRGKSYCINTFTAHDYWVNSLKFRDNILISGAADDTIKIWDFSPRQRAAKKASGLWFADVVSSRPKQTYITNPITSACILS